MKKSLSLLISLLISIPIFADDNLKQPLGLFNTLDHKNNVIFLDKQSNQHLSTLEYQTLYSYRKVKDSWLAAAQGSNKKWGYINEKGKWIVKPTLDKAKSFSKNGLARFQLNDKWGFIKADGQYLLEPKYHHVTPFTGGLAAIQEEEKGDYYYIDTEGKKAFEKSFSSAQVFAENGLAGVATSDSVTVYDVTIDKVTKKKIKGKEFWGYINTNGEIVIKPQFRSVSEFNKFNIAKIRDSANNSRLIDTKGAFINDTSYEYLWDFSQSGMAWSTSLGEDKFEGYIDSKGKEVWKASYHDFGGEHNGLLVNKRNGFQVFDPSGKLIIEEKSTWADNFTDAEVTVALRSGKWGILTKEGSFKLFPDNIIAPLTSDTNWVFGFYDGLIPMINQDREIIYFDRKAEVQYSYRANDKAMMTLFDKDHKVIWKSNTKSIKAYPFLARGVDELFMDNKDYGEGINDTIETLLKSKTRKYYIPNPIYGSTSANPYDLTADINEIKKGAIKIIAQGYVSSEEWGQYYFIDNEGSTFGRFLGHLEKLITKKYGKPFYSKSYRVKWKVDGKILKLEKNGDSGDGDFYNQLVLEVFSEK